MDNEHERFRFFRGGVCSHQSITTMRNCSFYRTATARNGSDFCPSWPGLFLNRQFFLARLRRAFAPGFTNPRWLATLRSPRANFLHASGVQTSSPKGAARTLAPGLSEAIPGVIETLYTDAR